MYARARACEPAGRRGPHQIPTTPESFVIQRGISTAQTFQRTLAVEVSL